MSAFFMVELKNVTPAGVKLSKKNICFVEIRPKTQETDKEMTEKRNSMIKHFLQNDAETISWGY